MAALPEGFLSGKKSLPTLSYNAKVSLFNSRFFCFGTPIVYFGIRTIIAFFMCVFGALSLPQKESSTNKQPVPT